MKKNNLSKSRCMGGMGQQLNNTSKKNKKFFEKAKDF
tara:strand:- start:697 stop:807 length:111 start_codon:yes stop_codon:yes gene_type:complete